MRVTAAAVTGHPGIGDVSIDFRGSDGRGRRTVILAGENGSGKSIILETIFLALCPYNTAAHLFDHKTKAVHFVEVELDPGTYGASDVIPNYKGTEVSSLKTFNTDGVCLRPDWPAAGRLWAEWHWSFELNRLNRYIRWTDHSANHHWIMHNGYPSKQQGWNAGSCYLSEANVTFAVPEIRSTTATADMAIDAQEASGHQRLPYRGGYELGSQIAQLLVDIRAADSENLTRWVEENPGKIPSIEISWRRIKRFTDAFEQIFPQKRLVGVEQKAGKYEVIFEENGRRTSLAHLSTGEKQIVFRGAFLLRQLDELPGSIVLIDEPELSLHPKWQSRIIDFYNAIVPNEEGKSSQIILATHSPFVVHGAPAALHVILKRAKDGHVRQDQSPTYPGVTPTDVAISTFDLQSFIEEGKSRSSQTASRHLVLVEGPSDARLLKLAWEKRRGRQEMAFDILPANGARVLNRLLNQGGPLLKALGNSGTYIVGIFDFDHEGFGQWNGLWDHASGDEMELRHDEALGATRRSDCGLLWAMLLPVPEHRRTYASTKLASGSRMPIELLFPDEFLVGFACSEEIAGVQGVTRLAPPRAGAKDRLAEYAKGFPPEAFLAFDRVFARIETAIRLTAERFRLPPAPGSKTS